MAMREPAFTIGIEEEYLLVDKTTGDLVSEAPGDLMAACESALDDQVSPEFLQCQIEVGTRVCKTLADARADLVHLRGTIAHIAGQYNLAPIAASTHPFADWTSQRYTDKARYATLARDLQGVARRMLICGMHVHVAIDDADMRIDLFNQMPYFLPHLLALSTSSPFWQGRDTGLKSYRLTIFDNLPRTGLPPGFDSYSEFERVINMIIATGIIEDATKIWWDLRPSGRFPTVEMRICDIPTRVDDTLAIAAVYLCTMRMLYRLRRNNQRWRQYDRFLLNENRWRAQRYGMAEGLLDYGRGELVGYGELLDELIELIMPDAEALGCVDDVVAARTIVKRGTSAEDQRRTYDLALAMRKSSDQALRDVVQMLIKNTVEGV